MSDLAAIGTALVRKSPERLRSAQFPLLAAIFLKGMAAHLPDLGVLFTNHVGRHDASLLVRHVPRRFREPGRLRPSSMGQAANADIMLEGHTTQSVDYRIAEQPIFESAMIPQYTFGFATEAAATAAADQLRSMGLNSIALHVDQSGNKITASVSVAADAAGTVVINGRPVPISDLGIIAFDIDDHHSGRHHPIGSVLISNDTKGHFASWQGSHGLSRIRANRPALLRLI